MERPHLLDLGRLSGSNIEFFARRGCKVQVEDLLLAFEAEPVQKAPVDSRGADGPPETSGTEDGPARCRIQAVTEAGAPAPAHALFTNPPAAPPAMARPAPIAGPPPSAPPAGAHPPAPPPGPPRAPPIARPP